MDKYTCNGCVHRTELFKHPSNRGTFKGSIKDKTGLYACTVFGNRTGIIFDQKDPGGCEMYDDGRPKKKPFVPDEKRLKRLLNDYPTSDQQYRLVKDIDDIVELKQYYVRNQNYGCAAQMRDAEKKAIEREEIEKQNDK